LVDTVRWADRLLKMVPGGYGIVELLISAGGIDEDHHNYKLSTDPSVVNLQQERREEDKQNLLAQGTTEMDAKSIVSNCTYTMLTKEFCAKKDVLIQGQGNCSTTVIVPIDEAGNQVRSKRLGGGAFKSATSSSAPRSNASSSTAVTVAGANLGPRAKRLCDPHVSMRNNTKEKEAQIFEIFGIGRDDIEKWIRALTQDGLRKAMSLSGANSEVRAFKKFLWFNLCIHNLPEGFDWRMPLPGCTITADGKVQKASLKRTIEERVELFTQHSAFEAFTFQHSTTPPYDKPWCQKPNGEGDQNSSTIHRCGVAARNYFDDMLVGNNQ
jgi:hypothetical protein